MQQQDNHEYPFLYQRQTCHQVQPNQATYQKRQKCQPATYLQEVQLNGLETLVIIMVANKYAFLQITRRRFLNEWEAFKKVISRRNIRRRITIPLTLSNLKLLRRITRTENILHRNFTRRQVAIQNRVASNIGISQS